MKIKKSTFSGRKLVSQSILFFGLALGVVHSGSVFAMDGAHEEEERPSLRTPNRKKSRQASQDHVMAHPGTSPPRGLGFEQKKGTPNKNGAAKIQAVYEGLSRHVSQFFAELLNAEWENHRDLLGVEYPTSRDYLTGLLKDPAHSSKKSKSRKSKSKKNDSSASLNMAEVYVALFAAASEKLPGPVRRPLENPKIDFFDGQGRPWDVKSSYHKETIRLPSKPAEEDSTSEQAIAFHHCQLIQSIHQKLNKTALSMKGDAELPVRVLVDVGYLSEKKFKLFQRRLFDGMSQVDPLKASEKTCPVCLPLTFEETDRVVLVNVSELFQFGAQDHAPIESFLSDYPDFKKEDQEAALNRALEELSLTADMAQMLDEGV